MKQEHIDQLYERIGHVNYQINRLVEREAKRPAELARVYLLADIKKQFDDLEADVIKLADKVNTFNLNLITASCKLTALHEPPRTPTS